jgi:hypothetical protein
VPREQLTEWARRSDEAADDDVRISRHDDKETDNSIGDSIFIARIGSSSSRSFGTWPRPDEREVMRTPKGHRGYCAQKKRHQMKMSMMSPNAPIGPYYTQRQHDLAFRHFLTQVNQFSRTCLSSSSQFILTAAFLYFLLSSRRRPLISPIRSRLSPRYRRSSMFLVMTFVTSFNSSLSLSRFCVALLSWYVFFVRWMKVSKSRKA